MKIDINNINRDEITNLVSLRLYAYGFVTDLVIKNNHVESVVNLLSKKYSVSFDVVDESVINQKCSCGKENCEHLLATIHVVNYANLDSVDYHRNLEDEVASDKLLASTRRENSRLMEITLMSRMIMDERKKGYNASLESIISKERYELDCSIENQNQRLCLSYRIGNEKKYVVKNISNLLNMIRNKVNYKYGKSLEMVHQIESFDEFSKKQIKFLQKQENILKQQESYYKPELGRYLFIDEENIDFIYDTYELYSGTNFICTTKDKKIQLRWIKRDKYDELECITDLSNYKFGNKHFYKISKKKMKYIFTRYQLDNQGYCINLLNQLKKGSIKILKDETKQFYKYVLSELLEYFDIDNLPDFSSAQVDRIKIFGDINQDGDVDFRVEYIYSDQTHVHGLQDNQLLTYQQDLVEGYIKKYANRIENNHAIFDSNSEDTLTFIEKGCPFLQEYADVYISESLRKYNEHKNYKLTVGVRYNSNLLVLDIQSDELPKDELAELLTQYRRKKKFFRLKNGELIHLNAPIFEELNQFVDNYHIELDELENEIQLDPYRMFTIDDDASSSENLLFDRKNSFNNMIDKFEQVNIDKISVPNQYENILRDYQKDGIKWMKLLRETHFNGILADDMGLGKTLQVIALIEDIKSDLPCIVVAPSSLIYNWKDEVEKFSKVLNCKCVLGNQENRKKILSEKADLYITSYDYMRRDIELYENREFEYVILDEAQYIKNQKTQNAISVKKLKAKHKLALTGTPIENSLAELWSIFDFLMPNYLFNYHYFLLNYENDIVRNDDEEKKKRLKQLVSPFILRRNKKDVLTELPDKIEKTQLIEFSEDENKLYLAHLAQVNNELKMMDDNMNKIEVLAMLTRLRQLCCEPRLLFDNIYHSSSKLKACTDLIVNLKENNQKVLLFSSFTSCLNLIEEELNILGISYLKLTGQTSKEKRKELIRKFQNGKADVFLISLKAGGTGLNLTAAQAVIHFDPWWNVSAQNQATDRAYRIGQEKNVQVFKLVMKNSIEEKIIQLQEKKKDLADTFIEGNEGSISKMSKEDIMELFK